LNKTQPSRPTLNRRGFLGLLAAAGTTAAFGHVLFTYAPWLDYNEQVERTWDTPFQMESTPSAQARELIRYATLAPNGHNTQPWQFTAEGDTICILPDDFRRLAVVDPHDRALWISLGCALENLVIAAQSAGYESEITYPTPGAHYYISVQLRQTTVAGSNPLFDAIPDRQNTRSPYDGRPVPSADLERIESIPTEAGISLRVFTAADQIEAILEYIKAGDQRQYGDQAFIDELVHWIRFNKPEAFRTLDGLYTRCSGNPEIPRWLGRLFVTTSSAGQQAQTDERNVRSSSGLLVLVSEQDDKRDWIDTGRVYERLALTLTTLGIKCAFLNQPIEVAELRAEFQSYLDLGTAQPQLLMRFGYAEPMPHSLRRPIEQVIRQP
jgi:hypothetical protein